MYIRRFIHNSSRYEIIIIGFCFKCRTYLSSKLLGIEIYIYKYSRYYKIIDKSNNLLEKKSVVFITLKFSLDTMSTYSSIGDFKLSTTVNKVD